MKKLRYLFCIAILFAVMNCFADWVPARNGYVPDGAWAIGYEEDGSPLYLCRAFYRGLQPGKVRPGFSGCNISYAGKEITISKYSVFVNELISRKSVIIQREHF